MLGDVLYGLAPWMLKATLWGSFYYYAYYTNEKWEAQTHDNMSWYNTARISLQGQWVNTLKMYKSLSNYDP